jgi:hypothetical protein
VRQSERPPDLKGECASAENGAEGVAWPVPPQGNLHRSPFGPSCPEHILGTQQGLLLLSSQAVCQEQLRGQGTQSTRMRAFQDGRLWWSGLSLSRFQGFGAWFGSHIVSWTTLQVDVPAGSTHLPSALNRSAEIMEVVWECRIFGFFSLKWKVVKM